MGASRIEQAIVNPASDAIDHSPDGARVTIALSREAGTARFSAGDEGPGIPVEAQEVLFQPFEKAFAPKSGGTEGTGLGPAFRRKIIEAHQGRIAVHSREGRRTPLSFVWPLHEAAS